MAAWDLRTLLLANGEVASLPYGHATLAAAALERRDVSGASQHIIDSLEVIRRTRASVALDHTLLSAARVAASLDRFDMAATLHAARAGRQRSHGLVDPRPIARLVAHEVAALRTQLGQVTLAPDGELPDEPALIDVAISAVAA